MAKQTPDFSLEIACGAKLVAGVDEAGRGPLCGPVVAAAVIFVVCAIVAVIGYFLSEKIMDHLGRK